ncbi:MAG: DUF4242 domain-containing protein [Longimicrobiales bacterium]
MPLYMDIHKNIDGLTAGAVAEAHRKDLETQAKHGVEYLRYWYNEDNGTVFCLCAHRAWRRRTPCTARRTAYARTRSSRSSRASRGTRGGRLSRRPPSP